LEQRLIEAVHSLSTEEKLTEKNIDAELSIDEVNEKLQRELERLAPFGVGNPKPIFLFKNVSPISLKTFGKTGDHVELVFKNSSNRNVSAIAFFGAKEKWAEKIKINIPIDLVASIEKSMFRGKAEIRLRIAEATSL
jgi:single-stranded-DNA-specific exonuclease